MNVFGILFVTILGSSFVFSVRFFLLRLLFVFHYISPSQMHLGLFIEVMFIVFIQGIFQDFEHGVVNANFGQIR